MRFVWGLVIASCLTLPWAALASPQQQAPSQQEPQPAASAPTQDAPNNPPVPQGEKLTPGDSKSETKPETKTERESPTQTEPPSPTKTEAPSTGSSQGASESSAQPKTAPKKKEEAKQSKAGSRRQASGKGASVSAPGSTPRRIVVREGGAKEPEAQIVSNLTPEEASRERQNTEDLLNSTRDILQQLSGRSLDEQRQETVSQIHHYMEGSRSALKEGDIARAQTLALKASLLAGDLAIH